MHQESAPSDYTTSVCVRAVDHRVASSILPSDSQVELKGGTGLTGKCRAFQG